MITIASPGEEEQKEGIVEWGYRHDPIRITEKESCCAAGRDAEGESSFRQIIGNSREACVVEEVRKGPC